MLLSELVKTTPTDLKQVSVTIQTTLAKLKDLQENQEDSLQSLLSSYDEQLHKIQENCKKLIADLNKLEQKTKQKLKDTLTKLQAPLERDINKCATLQDELKQLGDAIHVIGDKSKQELSLIASIKCQDRIQQFEKYQKENFVEVKSLINFQHNIEIVQYLSKLSGLGRIEHITQTLKVQGNPNQIIRMYEKSEYNVRARWDNVLLNCSIIDVCVLPSGLVLAADDFNNNVKLLNQQYQVVSQCSVSGQPFNMSLITPSEVGVTVGSKIKFIEVNNSKLVKVRKLQLQHTCKGIAYHEGNLFVTSGTALYKYRYAQNDKIGRKLHENKYENTGKNLVGYIFIN
ncbi:hypothetical protein DPMN_079195 [Dreissena polymorpha]|uniref:Uncharacterized protein n=1 Tax=Dreissena polymorpha TaxID=45954 RepID=A0A9D3YS49_DREPO|nr:hypothetical protein DPMN_079195 [Dreissena polymorpha]